MRDCKKYIYKMWNLVNREMETIEDMMKHLDQLLMESLGHRSDQEEVPEEEREQFFLKFLARCRSFFNLVEHIRDGVETYPWTGVQCPSGLDKGEEKWLEAFLKEMVRKVLNCFVCLTNYFMFYF